MEFEGADEPVVPPMVATTVEEARRAWAFIDKTWRSTFKRAAQLPEATLHERVDDEWSFVETQRHLLFATDVWLRRDALGDPDGWHRLGMPPDLRTGQPDADNPVERWGIDVLATPSYAEVLAVRGEYLHLVGDLVDRLTPGELRRPTSCSPPWIAATVQVPMSSCFGVVIREEWEHHRFAVRDLSVLERLP
jgi:hypothetical protein